MVEGADEPEGEQEEKTTKSTVFLPAFPAELSLWSKMMAGLGPSLSWMSKLTDQYARIGLFSSDILASIPMNQIIQVHQSISESLTKTMAVTSSLQATLMKSTETAFEALAGVKLPNLAFEMPTPVRSTVMPSVDRLRSTMGELAYVRERIENHEERLQALEGVIKKLRDLVEDPELPEEYKEEVRGLLTDLQRLAYVR